DMKANSVSVAYIGVVCATPLEGNGFECFEEPPLSDDPMSHLLPPAEQFRSVRTLPLSVVGIDALGQMYAWSFLDGEPQPTPSGAMREAFAFTAGNCGVRASDGKPVCVSTMPPIDYSCDAGSDRFGQLNPPDVVLEQVAAGRVHACGVQEDDTLVCWGAGGPSDL